MLIPMYFVIGVWGGPQRVYAAIKFVLYTMVGSVLMLVAILALYVQHGAATGVYTFDLPVLARCVIARRPRPGPHVPGLRPGLRHQGAAVPVPHLAARRPRRGAHRGQRDPGRASCSRWAPTGSCASACRSSRDASLSFGPLIFALAVIGIIYGAWVSTVQPDMKKLVAYSSVSHLGLRDARASSRSTSRGWWAAVIQMVNHGLSTGALFLMVGMIYERRHTRLIADFGGLWPVMPAFSALFLVVVLVVARAARAERLRRRVPDPGRRVPGEPVAGRAGHHRHHLRRGLHAVDVPARDLRRVTHEENRASLRPHAARVGLLVPVVALIVWIGVYPAAFTGKTEARVRGAHRRGPDEGQRGRPLTHRRSARRSRRARAVTPRRRVALARLLRRADRRWRGVLVLACSTCFAAPARQGAPGGVAARRRWSARSRGALARWSAPGRAFRDMVVLDNYALFFTSIICYAGALVVLLSLDYLRRTGTDSGEYYALVLFATAGMMLLASRRRPHRRVPGARADVAVALRPGRDLQARLASGEAVDEVLPARRLRLVASCSTGSRSSTAPPGTHQPRPRSPRPWPRRPPRPAVRDRPRPLAGRVRVQDLLGALPHVGARRVRGRAHAA